MWRFHVRPKGGVWNVLTYPPELRAINLDTDWVYRRLLPMLGRQVGLPILQGWVALRGAAYALAGRTVGLLARGHRPPAPMGEPWPAGLTSLWAVVVLGVCLVLSYLNPLLGP